MKTPIDYLLRQLSACRRPSREKNLKRIQTNGENLEAIAIRDANSKDSTPLGQLHAQVWKETYWYIKQQPNAKVRIAQWEALLQQSSDQWFCLLVSNEKGKLIGFAKGQTYAHNDLPQFSGELNKIYLLQSYQRLGLGKKLLQAVADRFLGMGINNMVLFGDPKNPSGKFHEAMGAHKLYSPNGAFHGAYAWDSLTDLF